MRSTLIIVSYFALCSVLVWKSLQSTDQISSNKDKAEVETAKSEFQDVRYFQNIANTPRVDLVAKLLTIQNGDVEVSEPKGNIHLASNEHYRYSASKGAYLKKIKKIILLGNVEINNKQVNMKCDNGSIRVLNKYAKCQGRVKSRVVDIKNGDQLLIDADTAKMWWEREFMKYTGSVKGKVVRKYKFEPGVDFTSQELSFYHKDLKAELEGDVRFKYEGIKSRSGRADLFLDNYNKELKYYVLYDDIEIEQKISQPGGGFFIRKAYSEVLEAFNRERKIVLKGTPRVSQGKDMTRGYKMTLFLDREIMEVDDSSSIIKIKK